MRSHGIHSNDYVKVSEFFANRIDVSQELKTFRSPLR